MLLKQYRTFFVRKVVRLSLNLQERIVFYQIGFILLNLLSAQCLAAGAPAPTTASPKPAVPISKPAKARKAEPTASTVLEGARANVLAGKKAEAIQALAKYYSGETFETQTKPQLKAEYLKSWEEIANLFLTDKAQNQYTLAESMWMVRPNEAFDFLKTAAQQEAVNLPIHLLAARAALRAQDCTGAEAFAEAAEKIFAPGAEVRLVGLQSKLCKLREQAQAAALNLKMAADSSALNGELDSAIRAIIVADHWRRRDFKTAKAALTAWEAQAASDPEMWYWKWKTSDSLEETEASAKSTSAKPQQGRAKDRTAGRNYLRICSELTPRRRKDLSVHPELCLWTDQVEAELKSGEKQEL